MSHYAQQKRFQWSMQGEHHNDHILINQNSLRCVCVYSYTKASNHVLIKAFHRYAINKTPYKETQHGFLATKKLLPKPAKCRMLFNDWELREGFWPVVRPCQYYRVDEYGSCSPSWSLLRFSEGSGVYA